jgi:hypothetical protein
VTTACGHCSGTGVEPEIGGLCVGCDGTGHRRPGREDVPPRRETLRCLCGATGAEECEFFKVVGRCLGSLPYWR